jgi:hypothetical protein
VADNITLPGTGEVVATDDVAGRQFQIIKVAFGADGSVSLVEPGTGLPVSGPLTNAELRAAAVPVSGTFWQATQPVSGPLTDAELRAAAVPVSGTFWQATQPISAAALPLPGGAATETTLAALNAKVPAAGQALMAASQPVAIASNQSAVPTFEAATVFTGAAAQTAIVNNILENPSGAAGTAVDNIRACSVQVVSTGTGGTFIFEQSNDNANWIALPVYNAALVTGVPITAAITATASQIIYAFPVRCRFIRLRIVSTITGGSIQAFSRFSSDPYSPAVMSVAQPTAANLQVTVNGGVSLVAGTTRAAFIAHAGIWYDDSSTTLAASATFTGTSRDATVTATATAWANAATYAEEVRACAESDVTGTLWLEVSRDNTAWRRIRSVATVAIAGGGFAAELIYAPSWRYWRIGYTNGGTIQARFTIGTIALAA